MLFVFDLGTTSLKAALFDTRGRLTGKASVPIGLEPVQNRNHREVDPGRWISAVKTAYGELTEGKTIPLEAVVVSGNGPTLAAVDQNGKALGNAMSWMDRRGTAEAEHIRRAAGYYVDPTFYLPKALWIREHRPEDYSQVRYFLACPEFMIYFLTKTACTILPGDNFLRYFWTDKLLDDLEMDRDRFPAFVDPGAPVGEVTGEAYAQTGIPEGTTVFAGGPDFVMSLLGTATTKPGRACDRAGTSEGINLCTASLLQDERLMGYGHVIKGLYNVSGIISTSGKALEWVLDVLGLADRAYEDIFDLAEKARQGSRGLLFLPYLTGERAPHWDPLLRGSFMGLSLLHGAPDMLRSVLESVGFAMRDVIAVIEEHGNSIEDLRITGNPSKSRLWNRIKADITGKPILVPEFPESELLGDACIALRGIGVYQSLQEAAEQTVQFGEVIEPDREKKALYDDMFGLYREFHSRTADIAHRLSEMQIREES